MKRVSLIPLVVGVFFYLVMYGVSQTGFDPGGAIRNGVVITSTNSAGIQADHFANLFLYPNHPATTIDYQSQFLMFGATNGAGGLITANGTTASAIVMSAQGVTIYKMATTNGQIISSSFLQSTNIIFPFVASLDQTLTTNLWQSQTNFANWASVSNDIVAGGSFKTGSGQLVVGGTIVDANFIDISGPHISVIQTSGNSMVIGGAEIKDFLFTTNALLNGTFLALGSYGMSNFATYYGDGSGLTNLPASLTTTNFTQLSVSNKLQLPQRPGFEAFSPYFFSSAYRVAANSSSTAELVITNNFPYYIGNDLLNDGQGESVMWFLPVKGPAGDSGSPGSYTVGFGHERFGWPNALDSRLTVYLDTGDGASTIHRLQFNPDGSMLTSGAQTNQNIVYNLSGSVNSGTSSLSNIVTLSLTSQVITNTDLYNTGNAYLGNPSLIGLPNQNNLYAKTFVRQTIDITGLESLTNGFGSYSPDQALVLTAGGFTNSTSKNYVVYVASCTAATLKNSVAGTVFSGLTTASGITVDIQPGGTFVATGTTYLTGASQNAQ